MNDIEALLTAIVANLQAMPNLFAALGGVPAAPPAPAIPAAITAYPDREPTARSLHEAIQGMDEPSMLVACRGMQLGQRGGIPQFRYYFSLILRCASEIDLGATVGYFSLLKLITEGIPSTSGGVRFIDTNILAGYDPPEEISFQPSADANGTEFWQYNFALQAQGG